MAKTAAKTVIITAPNDVMRKVGTSLLSPLRPDYTRLLVTDEESYLAADGLLGRIRNARRMWDLKMDPIIAPAKATVTVAKETLKGAQALFTEVDAPLEDMERGVKAKMKGYQEEKLALQRAQEAETARLQHEADEKERLSKLAPTPAVQTRLQNVANTIRASIAANAQPQTKVKGASSVVRTETKVRLIDLNAVVVGITQGLIPIEVIEVDWVYVRKFHKADEAGTWPGFESYDDINIAGR